MAKYQFVEEKGIAVAVLRDDGALVPFDNRNRDCGIEYLNWLDGFDADGNDLGTGKNVPDAATTAGGKY